MHVTLLRLLIISIQSSWHSLEISDRHFFTEEHRKFYILFSLMFLADPLGHICTAFAYSETSLLETQYQIAV